MPEGLLLAFDSTWKQQCFQTPIVALVGRILAIRYVDGVVDMLFVLVLAPGEDASEEEKNRFYAALNRLLRKVKARTLLVLFGDFNARLGQRRQGEEQVLGEHCFGREAVHRVDVPNCDFAMIDLLLLPLGVSAVCFLLCVIAPLASFRTVFHTLLFLMCFSRGRSGNFHKLRSR